MSRWRKLGTEADGDVSGSVMPGSVQVRSMAVYACPDADYSLPSKSAIKDKQFELVELVGGHTSVRTTFGASTPDEEGLFRVALKGAVQPIYSDSGVGKGSAGAADGLRAHG